MINTLFYNIFFIFLRVDSTLDRMHFLPVARPVTPLIKGNVIMNTYTDETLEDDAFEPIELGSVSEETKGQPNGLIEFFGQNSRD